MAIPAKPLRTVESYRYVPRFLTVGLLSTFLDVGLFVGLHVWLGIPELVANTSSYSVGMLSSFILHRRWTFADRPPKAMAAQFGQFALVNLVALILNNVIVLLLAHPLSAMLAYPESGDVAAKLFATGTCVIWNFFANNFWTFRDPVRQTVKVS